MGERREQVPAGGAKERAFRVTVAKVRRKKDADFSGGQNGNGLFSTVTVQPRKTKRKVGA